MLPGGPVREGGFADRSRRGCGGDDDLEDYYNLGKQFVAKSGGVAWFDSADAILQGQMNQLPNAFSSSDTEEVLIPLDQNQPVKDMYTSILAASVDDGLSAHLQQWQTDWTNAFQKGSFATMLCPGWMLGVIEGNAEVSRVGTSRTRSPVVAGTGRVLRDRAGAGREPGGGACPGGVVDRAGAADQGVQGQGHVPHSK